MLLQDKLKSYTVILASASPRRRELLKAAGITYRLAEKFECDEAYPATLPAEEVAPYLSLLKSLLPHATQLWSAAYHRRHNGNPRQRGTWQARQRGGGKGYAPQTIGQGALRDYGRYTPYGQPSADLLGTLRSALHRPHRRPNQLLCRELPPIR